MTDELGPTLYGPLLCGIATDDGPAGETQLVMDFMNANGIDISDVIQDRLGLIDTLGFSIFQFATDHRLTTNLDGVMLYYNTACFEGMPMFFGEEKIYGPFILLAIIAGEVTCFLSDDQSRHISEWLGQRQVTWHDWFHTPSIDSQAKDKKGFTGKKLH